MIKESLRNHQQQNLKPFKNNLQESIKDLKKENIQLREELKQQKLDRQQLQKHYKLEIATYQKKISQLNEKEIINSLLQSTNHKSIHQSMNVQEKYRKVSVKLEETQERYQQIEIKNQSLRKTIQKLQKLVQRLENEKRKNMEMSIMEKLAIQEKYTLLVQQVTSKKAIIEGLSKQLDKANKSHNDIYHLERKIQLRAKQMAEFQQHHADYFKTHQQKLLERIKRLQSQNQFLKKRIAKIIKKVQYKCKCEGEAAEWKDKLHKLARELVKTRVELGRVNFQEQRKNQHQKRKDKSESDCSSLASLSLSDSSRDSSKGKTKKIQRKK